MSSTTVGRLLHELGYSLQSVRKSREDESHPDRNEQFEHINAGSRAIQAGAFSTKTAIVASWSGCRIVASQFSRQ